MTYQIRPIELRDVAACKAIVRENWGIEPARRLAAEVSHVWSLDLDEEFKPQYFVAEDDGEVVGLAGMIPSWIMHRVWDFIWINVRKNRQREGIGRMLTEHRIMKVIAADGRVIQLMTKDVGLLRALVHGQPRLQRGGLEADGAAARDGGAVMVHSSAITLTTSAHRGKPDIAVAPAEVGDCPTAYQRTLSPFQFRG
jgi:GNAT superfamily N-acetyltransferase